MATRRQERGCGDGSPTERNVFENIWELAAKGEAGALPERALQRFCAKRMFCVREWRRGASQPQLLALDSTTAAEAVRLLPGWPRGFVLQVSEQRARVRLLRFTAAAWFHLCAIRIQRAHRRRRALKHAAEHIGSVVCIQAFWRGYSWRKKNDSTEIKAIRRRLEIINGEVQEEDKLYRRTALALGHLLTCKHLSAILEALKHLEVFTRLSPLCCENMAQSGAISKILVLIRSCNRSVPCMEVISYAIQVLLNVAKFEKTACAMYGVDSCVGTLLELLQIYREKPGDKVADKSRSIFTKTCCLLAVLLKTAAGASDVRNRSSVVDRVYSLYKHTARQHRVNTERAFYKQNKNSPISTPFIPKTPVSTRLVSRPKPGCVLRRGDVDVTTPLQAVQMLMDVLGIPC